MKVIKVGFIWHNVSSGNLGVGALSIANMILAKNALEELGVTGEFITIGDAEITDPLNKAKVEGQISHSFDHVTINIKNLLLNPIKLFAFYKLIKSVDVVLDIGAGDSFSDIYGFKRFFIQIFTKLFSANFAKFSVLSPQTIGPFKSNIAKFVATNIVKNTNFVYARDELSYSLGREFGDCNLSTDVALSMPFKKSESFSSLTGKRVIGVNVSGLLWNGGYTGDNQFGLAHSYKDFIVELIKRMEELDNIQIHLVSHVIATTPLNKVEDDYLACQEVYRMYPQCVLAEKFYNPIDAKNYISRLDYFTGARMHATVAAFSSGVAVTPYAYSRKFRGLYGSFGYDHVLEARELSLDESVSMIMADFNNRERLREDISTCKQKITTLTGSYVSGLKEVFHECK